LALTPLPLQAAPSKVLVVTVNMGFRHTSIPTGEKVLAELARESGAFTVEYVRVEPTKPSSGGLTGSPIKPRWARPSKRRWPKK